MQAHEPLIMTSDEEAELAGFLAPAGAQDDLEERLAIQEEGATSNLATSRESSEDDPAFIPPEHWKLLDVAEVRDWDCAPLRPIVEGLIARGNLVFNAAPTQTGKTLQGLYMARKILHPGNLFDRLPIHPVDKVLYLLLEDPDRRAQTRILDTDPEFPPTEPGRLIIHVAPGFALTSTRMFDYLEQLIIERQFDVVFLDTYQKATPGLSSFKDEEQGVILHRLADMTRKHDVTIMVMDHVRKSDNQKQRKVLSIDDIKGTGGKAQNADCVILMERTADRKQIKLQAFSKDFDKPVAMLLNVAPEGSTESKFSLAGDLEDLGGESRKRGEENRNKVLDAMSDGEWMATSAICEAVGMSSATIRRHLKVLIKDERVQEDGAGRWTRYRFINQSGEATV